MNKAERIQALNAAIDAFKAAGGKPRFGAGVSNGYTVPQLRIIASVLLDEVSAFDLPSYAKIDLLALAEKAFNP